jgi:hypothetical protein
MLGSNRIVFAGFCRRAIREQTVTSHLELERSDRPTYTVKALVLSIY